MKISIAYRLLSFLSIMAGFWAAVLLVLGIVVAFTEMGFKGSLNLFVYAFGLFASAVIFHVIWDIGARLRFLEHGLHRLHGEWLASQEKH